MAFVQIKICTDDKVKERLRKLADMALDRSQEISDKAEKQNDEQKIAFNLPDIPSHGKINKHFL